MNGTLYKIRGERERERESPRQTEKSELYPGIYTFIIV